MLRNTDENPTLTCKQWFEKAVPVPATKNFTTQLGVHCEEVHEMLIEVVPQDPEAMRLLGEASRAMHELAEYVKAHGNVEVPEANRIDFLDALCDQQVTAIGTAHMAGMDVVGAMGEVNRSNYSKFDDNGEPIFNENMKVMKGPNYSKANLAPFV